MEDFEGKEHVDVLGKYIGLKGQVLNLEMVRVVVL
jgi:hypothetical protein